MQKHFSSVMAAVLAACMCMGSTTIPAKAEAGDTRQTLVAEDAGEADAATAVTEFSVNLFKEAMEDGKDIFISPTSVLSAMAMTANGASGETLSQMEEAFGMGLDSLNQYFGDYIERLGKDKVTDIANSIWINENNNVKTSKAFQDTVEGIYDAEAEEVPMDEKTLKKINKWVDKNTNGMIQEILSDINPDAKMYLVNALCFEAKWEEIYDADDVCERIFTDEEGNETTVDMMYSEEQLYLADSDAEGFMKYYDGEKYAFAALLPDEGVSLYDYAQSLTGEALRSIIQCADSSKPVYTGLPKFTAETDIELSGALGSMGIEDAFTDAADFTNMFDTDVNPHVDIGMVKHKTFIDVNEQETRAAAVTIIEMETCALEPAEEEARYVMLDRPFLYMVIDCENDVPLFIGAMYNPPEAG